MNNVMEIIFITFLLLSLYSYALYPGLLSAIAIVMRRRWCRDDEAPTASIIISAYNEEAVIEEKIRNALSLDYPPHAFEVIVCSDGSTDRTNEIVANIEDPRVVLKVFPRLGKDACLNRVLPEATGTIVLFTDANAMFPRDLLRKLARNFADPTVGLVTGWTRYRTCGHGASEPVGLYSRLEMRTKRLESTIASCVGADGAIFAVRRSLYRPLGPKDINDFVVPLDVIRQGKRVVLDPEVFCEEKPAGGVHSEYQRQVRITTQTLGAIRRNLVFLNPFRYGLFAFFMLSHKVLRFLVPFFLAAALVANVLLLGRSPIYTVSLAGAVGAVVIAAVDWAGVRLGGRFSTTVKMFLVTACAHLVGWWRMAAGASDTIWTPQR